MAAQAFEPYLDIYVDSQAVSLREMIEQFARDFKSSLVFPEGDGQDENHTNVWHANNLSN